MDYDFERLGDAWTGLRLSTGLSRDEVYDRTGIPVPEIELWEDWNTSPDLDEIEMLAEHVYDCTPGELLDAALRLAGAHSHDVAGEKEDRDQAMRLWALLQEHGGEVTFEQMEAEGIATGNVPFNILHDGGYPVEIVRDREPPPPGLGAPKWSSGIRIRQEEAAA